MKHKRLNDGQILVLAHEVIAAHGGRIPVQMMDTLTSEEIGRLAEAVAAQEAK